ncbi:MAG TPA: hypothetical protein VK066_00930 [Chloroflexota bacterium]|nr:hypothetical protein [Chloroflexota bacterium]
MDDDAPAVRYDAGAGTLQVRLAGGEEVTVAGLGPDVGFWQGSGAAASGALWLSAEQADVLSKMIDYILQKVRISAPSQQALQTLAPQVAQLRDELQAAAAGSGEGGYYEEDDAGA